MTEAVTRAVQRQVRRITDLVVARCSILHTRCEKKDGGGELVRLRALMTYSQIQQEFPHRGKSIDCAICRWVITKDTRPRGQEPRT